jgi:copper resistance protein C
LALVGVCFVATSAFAHSYPKTAQPPMNGTVKTAPSEVVIDFTGDLEPKLSTVEVIDAHGARCDTGDAHTDPGDAKRMRVGVKPLPPGIYTVEWHVTSVDTHRTEGKFVFTIAP